MTASYSEAISNHSYSVMFLPQNTQRQRIKELQVTVNGGNLFGIADDNFGNKKFYGKITEPHKNFEVSVSGTAETGAGIFEEYTEDAFSCILYKYQTPLTEPGARLCECYNSLNFNDCCSPYDKALKIMRNVSAIFKYHSGATGIHEAAENAFALGNGVCQDYAHIMLSLLRMEHIPARYVVGMMMGDGASHAWVEALSRGFWYGFDVTNNKLVNNEYIRVSCGRDSGDCPIIKGKFFGDGIQQQAESVIVEEIQTKG